MAAACVDEFCESSTAEQIDPCDSTELKVDGSILQDSLSCGQSQKLQNSMSAMKLNSNLEEEDSMPKITKITILEDHDYPESFSVGTDKKEVKFGKDLHDLREGPQYPSPQDPASLEFVNFPFVKDPRTICLLRNTKVMYIFRGIPGSGKGAIGAALQFVYPDIVRCSASEYFWRTGEYQTTRTREDQTEAHRICQETANQACHDGRSLYIDNCNIYLWEMSSYLNLAKEHNYITLVVEPDTPWKNDPATALKKISGAVKLSIIQNKKDSWQDYVPKFFAWYINATDTKYIYDVANGFYQQCYQIPEIRNIMISYGLTEEPSENYKYNYSALDQPDPILYCVSFYTNFGHKLGAAKFATSDMLRRALGRATELRIIGLVLTRDCFLLRVTLTDDQMNLVNHRLNTPTFPGSRHNISSGSWRSRGRHDANSGAVGGANGESSRNMNYPPPINQHCPESGDHVCGEVGQSTCRWTDQAPGSSRFPATKLPTSHAYQTNQCRAHIQLGAKDANDCADNAIRDVGFIVACESNSRNTSEGKSAYTTYELAGEAATVVNYGSKALAVYFKQHLIVRAVLASSSEAPVKDKNRRPLNQFK